jgi:hypothetical protein
MDGHSWMCWDSPERLRRMNYCTRIEGFINYTLSNPINISWGGIRCPCKRFKNKKFLDLDIVTMNLLQKEFVEKYLYWFVHEKPYVPYDTIVERMIGSTFSSSNVHEVVDDNSNPYRNIVMKMMRIN